MLRSALVLLVGCSLLAGVDAPPEVLSRTREAIVLDGEWRFQPGRGAAARQPVAEAWGAVRVPGSWHGEPLQRGNGAGWDGFKPRETNKGWYERTVHVPATWAGKGIDVRFDRVSTDATVWIDDHEVGQIRWPWGVIDLSKHLTPGATHRLRVAVVSVNDRSTVTNFMGYVDEPTQKAELDSRGIIGSVRLLARPAQGRLDDLLLRPSVREKALSIDLELDGVTTAGEIDVSAQALDESGAVERSFAGKATVAAAAKQTVTVVFPWADARLWDYRQPNRYTLVIRVQGSGIDDELRQEFGFREFWIEGRKFFLNGSEIRLRPGNLDYGAMPEQLLARGLNFGHHWPKDQIRRGQVSDYDLKSIAQADRIGLLVDANLAHLRHAVERWNDADARGEWLRIIDQQVRLYRNHPSVVMYTHSANAFQSPGDGDPWRLGTTGWNTVQEYAVNRQRLAEAFAAVKAIDPKPIYAHHGTDNGEVYTSNLYLNFIPLQEREEWLSQWARSGNLPWMGVETGPPLYSSVMRGRDGYSHQGHSEPFPSEWAAVYLGRSAYAKEDPELRRLLKARYKPGNLQKEYEPHIRHDQKDLLISNRTGFADVLDLFITNTWRSWRTLGVSGGMICWHHDSHPALAAVNGDTLAWIADQGGMPDPEKPHEPAFTGKTHHYAPGSTLRKQVVLINDLRAPADYHATVVATCAGVELLRRELRGTLDVAATTFLPIELTLPASVTGRQVGELRLEAHIAGQAHSHALRFDVIPATAPTGLRLSVYDPAGTTTAWLRQRGCRVTPWTTGDPQESVAVIGRDALSAGGVAPGDVRAWVAAGGRLLVMGQRPLWTKYALHLRVAPHLSRRIFPVDPAHPVLAGLDQDNLRDWNGSSDLVESHPRFPGYDWVPAYGWRWGNRHSVATTPMEKPHHGAWRPILECEFDSAYSPLMELDHGSGRVTLCTLDLDGRSEADPAADLLGANLLAHVASAPLKARVEAQYLGDDAGAALLTSLGVAHRRVAQPESGAALLIVGGGPIDEAALRAALERGARVLVLRRAATDLPLGVKATERPDFSGSLDVPAWNEAAGLSPSDLRWRGESNAWLVDSGAVVGAGGQLGRMEVGQGVAIFAQLGPDAVPADSLPYFRFTRWRQTRSLCQLLANLGARFRQDDAFLGLLATPDHAIDLTGPWQAAATVRLPESPVRQWNDFQPPSARGLELMQPDAPDSAFQSVWVPAYLEAYGDDWRWTDGEVIFRRVIDLPAHCAGKDLFVSLGRVDENEITCFNGTTVGSSRSWIFPRGHRIPGALVQPGRNVLSVRVWDEGIHGGMCGSPWQVYLRVAGTDPGLYHPDYRDDDVSPSEQEADWKARSEQWKVADQPYRYYRW